MGNKVIDDIVQDIVKDGSKNSSKDKPKVLVISAGIYNQNLGHALARTLSDNYDIYIQEKDIQLFHTWEFRKNMNLNKCTGRKSDRKRNRANRWN